MILQFTRQQIVAFVQSGLMNIKSSTHWDVCKALSEGKTMERVADDFKLHYQTVLQIKKCKCPDV